MYYYYYYYFQKEVKRFITLYTISFGKEFLLLRAQVYPSERVAWSSFDQKSPVMTKQLEKDILSVSRWLKIELCSSAGIHHH